MKNSSQADIGVGERLKEERKRKSLTQEEAAAMVGVSREMWGRYERGAWPGGDVLRELAVKGFDVSYILAGFRPEPIGPDLTSEEAALIDNYRHADDKGRQAARVVLEAVSAQKQKKAA